MKDKIIAIFKIPFVMTYLFFKPIIQYVYCPSKTPK